jgi:hypothetical protein
MKRTILSSALALALFLSAATSLRAQIAPPPSPAPDPHTYSDPAMNFTAPPEAVLLGRRTVELKDLGDDLQNVAEWAIFPGKENQRTIALAMESFPGAPDQWEGQFESQSHNQGDGVLVRGKTPMSLLNGMPANFVEITYGSGFDTRKQYAVVWADGTRGVVLSLTSRIGEVSADEARQLLKNVTATRYPMYAP